MTVKIIYHEVRPGTPCADGQAACWTALKKYPDAETYGWTYQSGEVPEAQPGDRLVIVDFSFDANQIQAWLDAGVELEVIDHHLTAEKELSKFTAPEFADTLLQKRSVVLFDMKECGATLAWKHFFPDEPMPAFLHYVRDRDLWDFLLPKSNEIHEAMAGLRRSMLLYDLLEGMSQKDLLNFVAPVGDKLLAPKKAAIAAAVNRHVWEDVCGYNVPLVRLKEDGSEDRLTSEICMDLYRTYPDALFSACITSDGSYSLRSDKHKPNGGFDVGALAKTQGGGGHRAAAGFRPTPLSNQPEGQVAEY